MIRVLAILVVLALAISCLVECLQTDRRQVRYLPKPLWLFLILIPVAGPLAWLLFGRPRRAKRSGSGPTARRRPPAPRAPDDDPDFLARLDEQRRLAREEGLGPDVPTVDDEDTEKGPESRRDSGP